jgi:hypothetical protein
MKNYRTAKELPYTKKGTPVIVNRANGVVIKADLFKANKKGENLTDIEYLYIGDLHDLLRGGWIEEVKPREFYVRVSNNIPISVCEDIEPLRRFENEIVKVREVIDDNQL